MIDQSLPQTEAINTLLNNAYNNRSLDLPNSIVLAKKALQLSRNLNNQQLIGRSLNQLGLYYMIISDYANSTKHAKEAVACFTVIDDQLGIADSKYTIGSVHYKTDNYHEGLVCLIKAFHIYKKHDDFRNQSKVGKAIGTAYEYIGDQSNAFKFYKEAVKNARLVGDTNLESNVYNNLSGLLLKNNKTSYALKMIEHSIKLKKESGDTRGYGFAIYGRGKIHFALGDFEKAENDFLTAITTYNKVIEIMGACMAYNKLGKLYLKQDQLDKAEQAVLTGLNLSIKYNITITKIKGYHQLYIIYKKANQIENAFKYLELYLTEKELIMNTQTQQVMDNYSLINKTNVLEHEALLQKEKQKIIEKKNEDDQKALKLKQEFLSVMSHEIRTPLHAMTTIVAILEDQVFGENKKLIESLQFASNNLISIVNNVLDFSKLDSKKTNLEVENTNFDTLCKNILNLHLNLAQSKGLKLVLKNNVPDTTNYLIDQTKLTQILSNLIGNAIKFTEKGKVTFQIKLKEKSATHDTLLIKIKDTGEGIPKKDLIEIFDSFSQIKPIMTKKQGGTGLGLAIVKELVKLHDSVIKVNSKEQKGSEFYFTIQLERIAPMVAKPKPIFNQLKNKLILLAEDTVMNATLITKVLSKWGIKTEHAVNGKVAVEYAKNKIYDFILMDLHMPEMNGIDATKLIRTESNINKDTPIFAITADIMTTKNNKEHAKLFNDILWKPIEIEKLYQAIAKEDVLNYN